MWRISFEIVSCCSCINHSGLLFIVWIIINGIISIQFLNLSWLVHYLFPDMSFFWFPAHICCTVTHDFSFDSFFLVTLFTIVVRISSVDVDDLVLWEQQYPLGFSLIHISSSSLLLFLV